MTRFLSLDGVNPIKREFWFTASIRLVLISAAAGGVPVVTLMKILFYWRRQVNELFP
jgi:hypothetical protein